VKERGAPQHPGGGGDRRETKRPIFTKCGSATGPRPDGGDRDVIAEFKGSFRCPDFVDHYRAPSPPLRLHVWEERWARDFGYGRIIPEAVNGLDKLGITMDAGGPPGLPLLFQGRAPKIAHEAGGHARKRWMDNLHEVCGETGAAHPLLMMAAALEKAAPATGS
jgi:hypothetical protein